MKKLNSLSKNKFVISTFLLSLSLSTQAYAAIYKVSSGADADCSDGSCNLQAALNSAASSAEDDQINISQGNYIGNFLYKPSTGNNGNLTILGGWNIDFSSRNSATYKTILDGNNTGLTLALNPDIISGTVSVSGDLTVDGLTIKNGTASLGGGLSAFTNSPGSISILNNIIENNHAEETGGGCVAAVWDFSTDNGGNITFSENIVRGNSVYKDTNTDGEGGGCAFIVSGKTVVTNNLLYNNAVGSSDVLPAKGRGGGLSFSLVAGQLHLVNNTITQNDSSANDPTLGSDGGISIVSDDSEGWQPAEVIISNNIIFDNTSSSDNGNDMGTRVISSGDITGSSLSIVNNNYHGYRNSNESSAVIPSLSNNIDENPIFSTSVNSMYHLTDHSPCIDIGLNSAVNLPDKDLVGNIRIWDGNADGNKIVDMGCYEYGSQQSTQSAFSWNLFLPAIITGKK